jgi:hypothetical protein
MLRVIDNPGLDGAASGAFAALHAQAQLEALDPPGALAQLEELRKLAVLVAATGLSGSALERARAHGRARPQMRLRTFVPQIA